MFWIALLLLGNWRVVEARCNLTGSFLAPESAGSLGLRVKRTGEGQFTVINMEPDSPSSKVLHLGDSIFSLGGALTENMTLGDFSTKLTQLRGRDAGNVTVGFSTDHCSRGDENEDGNEDESEDEESDLEEEVIAHYRVLVENFHQPLGLRLSQNDEGMVVVGKTSSLEQWEAVEVGDVLEQIQGEDVVSSAKLKHLLQRFEGRKQLGILFSRVLSPEPLPKGSEEALRLTFKIKLSNSEAAGFKLAQLERTASVLDGYVAVTTSTVPYVFTGDRLREINSVPVFSLEQATALLADEEMVELLFVRGVEGTLLELETFLDNNTAIIPSDNNTNSDPKECKESTIDEMENLELLKQEAEAKVKEAEELTQQAAEAEALLLKKLEAKELQRKQDEDRFARLKATRMRLDEELRVLEEEERQAGLTQTRPTGACDKHVIAKLLADPEFMQTVAQLLLARQV
ncbi:hypothetical protein BASA82_000452 [Batrachochytrium salamandrivorans]|nr:hypothetical protein BASA81_003461 [Batrachochytrium salamandrivorans]KAH9262481.1 hypothetical protein BASA82_000452 [Batrachochytrium salamandrivorans]